MKDEKELSVAHLAAQRWKSGLLCIAAFVSVGALVTLCMPRLYEAEMKFLVNNERADLIISPEKAADSGPQPEVTETQINSEIELLKSRSIYEQLVGDERLYLRFEGTRADVAPSPRAVALAIRKLDKDLRISPLRKSNVISVTYASRDPSLSVSVLKDLGNRYLSAHLAAHSSPGTYKFFTDQVKMYKDEVLRIRQAVSDYHLEKQLFSMSEQRSALIANLRDIDNRIDITDAELASSKSRLVAANQRLDTLPRRVATQVRSLPNQQVTQQLETILTDLRNRRIDLGMKFKATDTVIKDIDAQIANTESDIHDIQASNSTETTTDLDIVRQDIETDFERGKITVEGLERSREVLASSRNGYIHQLGVLDVDYLGLQRLEQSLQEAQENYNLYARRLDEVRLADSLDREKFSNVVMIEQPVSSPLPVSPKLSVNLAVAFVCGTFAFVAFLLLREAVHGDSDGDGTKSLPADSVYKARSYKAAGD